MLNHQVQVPSREGQASAAPPPQASRPLGLDTTVTCTQAPVRLVACRAAGSRLVVSKIPRARETVPVWLLATHAYPASDGWHSQFKFSWLSTEARSPRDKSYVVADHGYDTQRYPRHWHSPNLNSKRAAGPG